MSVDTCEHCDQVFPARKGKRFCSEVCRRRAEGARASRRKAEARRAERERTRSCRGCGAADGLDWWVGRMQHPGAASSRCHACYLLYTRERYHSNPARRAGSLERARSRYQQVGAAEWNRARSAGRVDATCVACGLSFRRRNQNDRCAACASAQRTGAEARRRSVIARGDRAITWLAVGERDGWRCHLCAKPVPKVAGGASRPDGATVDHLVPIARGGEHVWSNVALAHRACNVSRGARGIVRLRPVG